MLVSFVFFFWTGKASDENTGFNIGFQQNHAFSLQLVQKFLS